MHERVLHAHGLFKPPDMKTIETDWLHLNSTAFGCSETGSNIVVQVGVGHEVHIMGGSLALTLHTPHPPGPEHITPAEHCSITSPAAASQPATWAHPDMVTCNMGTPDSSPQHAYLTANLKNTTIPTPSTWIPLCQSSQFHLSISASHAILSAANATTVSYSAAPSCSCCGEGVVGG